MSTQTVSLWEVLRIRFAHALARIFLPFFLVTLSRPPRVDLIPKEVSVSPSRVFYVQSSKDPHRRLRCHIFIPRDADKLSKPLPVHLNFHGSGFTMPCLGMDSEACAYLASQLNCIVIDGDYSKGPQLKFPAAPNDVLDIVAYIQANAAKLEVDTTRFTIGGFSAGACLALVAASQLPKGTFTAVIPWYPVTNFAYGDRTAPPVPAGNPAHKLTLAWRNFFDNSYIPTGTDRENPLLSPFFAPTDAFPPVTLIVGECDELANDCKAFIAKLRDGGADIVEMIVPGVGHGWDMIVRSGSPFFQVRQEAWELSIKRIKASWKK